MARLSGRRVGVFVEEGFEDLEFWVTVMRLREEGADVTIVGTHAGERYRGKNALSAASDVAAKEVSADDFDAVAHRLLGGLVIACSGTGGSRRRSMRRPASARASAYADTGRWALTKVISNPSRATLSS